MSRVKVVKIGGKVIDDEQKLEAFLKEFVSISGPKVLVHGGGSIASKMGERLGITPKMREGRRITDAETLEVITMVYGGLLNKNIVAKLQALGANAVGLSGADLNVISAKKRNPKPIDFGWVGDIETVNTKWLLKLLNENVIPVLAPLTHDGNGNILNTNADSIASFTASAISAEQDSELILCFEMEGVMNESELVTELNARQYRKFKGEGIITDGMIPKIDLGFQALSKDVKKVSIRSFEAVAESKSGTELVI